MLALVVAKAVMIVKHDYGDFLVDVMLIVLPLHVGGVFAKAGES